MERREEEPSRKSDVARLKDREQENTHFARLTMDPIINERIGELLLKTSQIDLNITHETLLLYLRQNIRVLVYHIAVLVFQDASGHIIHDEFLPGDVEKFRTYVKVLIDHWVR